MKTLAESTLYPTKTSFLYSLWTLPTLNTSALLTLSTCISTMVTLNTLMAQIRVSDDAHVKIMDRRTHVLINTVQVVDDIMAKVDGVITVPVDALNEPCKQCEEYKKRFDDMKTNTVSLQRFENMKQECDEEIDEGNKLREEIKALQDKLVAAKADIEALESISNVVVLDEDSEILG